MIEEVIFSVYVLGLVENALELLSFLQEKKKKIPNKATERMVKLFMLNEHLLLKIFNWKAGFVAMLQKELKILKFFIVSNLFQMS
ncbi:MAG TPA: hypothetical protein VNX68_11375 [Nitrosopumilaceae archaeon]|nr:hypothetical protein [Nitrosopumilaceae archaeon]